MDDIEKTINESIELGEVGFDLKTFNGKISNDPSRLFIGASKNKYILEMTRNNPYIGAYNNAKEALALKPDWNVTPTSEEQDAKDKAEYVSQVLFEDMVHPFSEFVLNAMTMSDYGFALCEIVWKKRCGKTRNKKTNSKFNDGLYGLRKIAPRAQTSIDEWTIDNHGDITNVKQLRAGFGEPIYIPYDKLLHFKIKGYNGNPEGISLFRNAFMSYFDAKNVSRIQKERLERGFDGLFYMKVPPQYMSLTNTSNEAKNLRRWAETTVKNVRFGRDAGLLVPAMKNLEFGITEGGNAVNQDPETIITRCNKEIIYSLLSECLVSVNEGKSSSNDINIKTKMFRSFIGLMLNQICHQINEKLIPQLFEKNCWELKNVPKLTYNNLDELDDMMMSLFLQSAHKLGLLTPTLETEKMIRKRIFGQNVPMPTQEQFDKNQVNMEVNTNYNTNVSVDGNEDLQTNEKGNEDDEGDK